MTSLHSIFTQKEAKIETATSPSVIEQFYIIKRQRTQNVELYTADISKFQNFEFLTFKFSKKNVKKNTLYIF